jgi:lysophospholipase L1-like esterase
LRFHRVLSVAIAISATAATVLFSAASATAVGAVNYVALGDSYASGVGADNHHSSTGSCYRSPNAYPVLWSNAKSPTSFSIVACSGATTTDLINNQVSALSSSTTLVSVTIGGNDVGFASVLQTCVLWSTSTCVAAINTAENEANTQLPGELDNALNSIRAHAPNARIVLLDYPELYDLSKSSTCVGLSTTDRTDLNQAVDIIDTQISAAAGRAGDVFGDVRAAFVGHEICDADSWLRSVDWLDLTESYHPTASGQSGGFYPVFSANAG